MIGAPESDRSELAFGDFLEHLRLQGFSLGVDHYLRLHELLHKMHGACGPADLANLLCPIIAKTAAEQALFHRTFHAFYGLFQTQPSDPRSQGMEDALQNLTPTESSTPRSHYLSAVISSIKRVTGSERFVDALILAVLLACTAGCLSYYSRMKSELNQALSVREGEARRLETLTVETQKLESQVQQLRTDSRFIESVARQKFGFVRSGEVIIKVSDLPALPPVKVAAPAQPSPQPNFVPVTTHRWVPVFAPLIFLMVYAFYLFRQRRMVLRKHHGMKPPYTWPLIVDVTHPRLYDAEDFYVASKFMRRRRFDGPYRIDLQSTVAATIESLGYTTFRHKPDSKLPEYLLLIDRISFHDHQAQLFDNLARELESEAVFVSRYFYDGDPRVCHGEEGAIYLTELQHRYPDHRLLIFGDGEKMIDPVTGNLASWTSVVFEWRHLGLLTSELPENWAFREMTLASRFLVLPATVEALVALIECFDSSEGIDLHRWRRSGTRGPGPGNDNADLVAWLREYLGEASFRWLCACAIYPELQWDLTLYLGSLPLMEAGLLNEENLLRLVRLPWFRKGSIPDEIRWQLVARLGHKTQTAIRSTILDLLLKHPPPEGSYAANTYPLDLVLEGSQWFGLRTRKKRFQKLQSLQPRPVFSDYTLVRSPGTSGYSPLTLLLPRRLRKIFRRHRLPGFMLRSLLALVVTIALMMMADVLTRSVLVQTNAVDAVAPADRGSEALILVRRESEDLVWLDENAREVGSVEEIGLSPRYSLQHMIPPIVKGFAEGNRSQSAVAEDLQRIAIYKEIERQFRETPNPVWDLIDSIDLTFPADVNIRLIKPSVLIHVGRSDFYTRTKQALSLLQKVQRGNAAVRKAYGIRSVDEIRFIDAARPGRMVVNIANPGSRKSSRRKR